MAWHLQRAHLALALSASIFQSATAAADPSKGRFGLHLSEVAMEGNHEKDAEALFQRLKYKVVGSSWASGWQQLNDALDKNAGDRRRVKKAVYFAGGWTHIIDPELVILTEEKILAQESKRLKATIVAWLSESTSDSYGFWVYERGQLLRWVLNVNGKLEGKGRRLSAEGKVKWKDAGEEEILALAHRLGPGFDPGRGKPKFRVYDLKEGP